MTVSAVNPIDTRISHTPSSRYSWQIFRNGTLFADLTGLCKNRKFTQTRSDTDQISFSISLDKLIELAQRLNTNPQDIIQAWVSEIRVSRMGNNLVAGELQPWDTNIGGDRMVNLTFRGWLDLFKWRKSSNSYTNKTALYILQAEHAATLARTYGSSGNYNGMTIGVVPSPDLTNTSSPTYDRKTLYEIFQEMTEEQNGFDIEVTWDKKLNVYYPYIGSTRNDIVFSYPHGNVKDITYSVDPTKSFNTLLARGKGDAESQISVSVSDTDSQTVYGIRDEDRDYSNVSDLTQLTKLANADLTLYKQPIIIHGIVFDGSGRTSAPPVGTFHIGDLVRISVANFELYADVNQLFKIDKIEVDIDDNDMETVTLAVTVPIF